MKKILLYSSKTNNTKKIADAIQEKLQADTYKRVAECTIKELEEYELIVIGGWIDKGLLNEEVMEFIKIIKGKKVAFYFTLGAYPSSMHAYDCIQKIKKELEKNNNEVVAHYHCQGAIDKKLMEWMKTLPNNHPHSPDQERMERWKDAEKHPNEEDFHAAKSFIASMLKKVGEESV